MSIKVGILGSGVVGTTLAQGFKSFGYTVQQGSRLSFKKIAEESDLIVLAVRGSAASEALTLAGAEALRGKVVIDTTNPIADLPPEDGVLRFFTSLDASLMEKLQNQFPETRFVKAFSSVGHAHMVKPKFSGVRPTMFICGNSDPAKGQVREILDQFGWDAEDMGTVKAARAIEPLCMLWCIRGISQNKWDHAFKLLKGN